MTDAYKMQRLFRDSETKLVIPNLRVGVMNFVTNIASSFVTNPSRNFGRYWARREDDFGTDDSPNVFDNTVTGILNSLINVATVGLGVTKIQTSQEYVMPFSKGIGSTGEVIHLLGAKNEMINLEFTTERYPGRLAYVLRNMLQYVLEEAQVVYLIDDLFLATPCLVRKTKLSKEGLYRGAVMGELELVSLSTGGSLYNTYRGSKNKVSTTVKQLKNSIRDSGAKIRNIPTAIAVPTQVGIGVMTILATLISAIAISQEAMRG